MLQYKYKPGNFCQKHGHWLSKVPDLHHGVFCTNKTLEVGSNYRGGTKLEVS